MIRLYITNYEIIEHDYSINKSFNKHTIIRHEYKYYLEDNSCWSGEFKNLNKTDNIITLYVNDNVIIEFPRTLTFFREKIVIVEK